MRCSATTAATRFPRTRAVIKSRFTFRTRRTSPTGRAKSSGRRNCLCLKTVNVIAAGKTVIVLDKSNKKLWQAALTYNVSGAGDGGFAGRESQFGAGPCVEHGDTLYVFDQAVLSAFDLATGNARWRLPSVGIVGLFFDEQGQCLCQHHHRQS